MKSVITLMAATIAVGCVSFAAYGVTKAQCAADYDKCKRKPEHIFDKGPCKKDRAACERVALNQTQNATKSRMLNGVKQDEPVNSMRPWDSQADTKEAARRRLEERERLQNGGIPAPDNSMRERVTGNPNSNNSDGFFRNENSAEAKKLEAQRRLKERQRSQNTTPQPNSGSGMREAIKSN